MNHIICGNSLDILPRYPRGYFHGCITSPPYWGLRDYSDAVECVFGGDEWCQHEWGPRNAKSVNPQRDHNGAGAFGDTRGQEEWRNGAGGNVSQGSFCSLCGAWRGQFGLEPTPEMYVEHTLEFLRAIRRVLRKDGTCWLNLGDSYNAMQGKGFKPDGGRNVSGAVAYASKPRRVPGLKPKDLVMIPFRVALAAQADGWWVRSVIIWDKPNPMPESVRDRPTTSHEYILLLTKSGESQYWTHRDNNGTRTRPKADWRWVNQLRGPETDYPPHDWKEIVNCPDCDGGIVTHSKMGISWDEDCERCGGKGEFQLWKRINLWQGHDYFYDADAIREPHSRIPFGGKDKGYAPSTPEHRTPQGIHGPSLRGEGRCGNATAGRNKRTVWTIATQPYPEAHFACVDDATDCLTVSGWKGRNELNAGNVIAAYDVASGSLRWEPLTAIYEYQVKDQEMISAKGRGVDFLVTPNHRCVIQRHNRKTNEWNTHVIEAKNLKKSQRIVVAAKWDTEELVSPSTPHLDLLELVGWFVTEGSIGSDTITLYQSGSHNPEYCEEITNLLDHLGADYHSASRHRPYKDREVESVTWRIRGAVANEVLSICENQRRLPSYFLTWSEDGLHRLYDGLMKGDGHFRDAGRATFVQKDKVLIEQVQALMVRLGFATTLRKRSENTWALYQTSYQTRNLRSETTQLLGRETYSGIVWCPHTPSGTFVARRDGRVFITGNTFPEALVEPMILTTPTKCCAECGAGWERVTEVSGGTIGQSWHDHVDDGIQGQRAINEAKGGHGYARNTLGFRPTCSCNAGTKPAVVVDCFAGKGTVGRKARQHNRDYVMIDMNPDYIPMMKRYLAIGDKEVETEGETWVQKRLITV